MAAISLADNRFERASGVPELIAGEEAPPASLCGNPRQEKSARRASIFSHPAGSYVVVMELVKRVPSESALTCTGW